jgi:hypothetical protein
MEILYQGKMFEVIKFSPKPGVEFETAVRAPGVGLIIEYIKDGVKGLVMTKELRHNLEGSKWDYRLPGGKVFDSLPEFNVFRESGGEIAGYALKAAELEAKQEVGVVGTLEYLDTAKAGGSVEWDLHYFLLTDTDLGEQELEEHEKGEIEVVFLSMQEVFKKLVDKEIAEGRSADVLWRYLTQNNLISFHGDN